VTYYQQERYDSAVDRHINFKPGVNYRRGGQRACEHTCGMLSALVYNVSGSNKPEVYKMQKNQWKTSVKRRNFEIWVGESNGGAQ